jgi:cytochrome c oxidase assembly protein subunit 15
MWLAVRSKSPALIASAWAVACLALLQATLGVWTLLLAVPIPLGLAHQAGAIAVFAAALHHLWLASRPFAVARGAQTAASA